MEHKRFEALVEEVRGKRFPVLVRQVVLEMLEKGAADITVLKVKEISDVTDYMVVCTVGSTRQGDAVADHLERQLRSEWGEKVVGVEGQGSNWILLDYADVLVRLFTEETRRHYALEKLWMDAKRTDFSL